MGGRSHHGRPSDALFAGGIHVADHVAGPYTKLEGCSVPGGNPAPIYRKGVWYATYQQVG